MERQKINIFKKPKMLPHEFGIPARLPNAEWDAQSEQ